MSSHFSVADDESLASLDFSACEIKFSVHLKSLIAQDAAGALKARVLVGSRIEKLHGVRKSATTLTMSSASALHVCSVRYFENQ